MMTERFKELNELVERSSEVIAHYWPMTGFVHHNPLHDQLPQNFQDQYSATLNDNQVQYCYYYYPLLIRPVHQQLYYYYP